MDPPTKVLGVDDHGNMVFTVVKPVMGLFQVSSDQASVAAQGGVGMPGLSNSPAVPPQAQPHPLPDRQQEAVHPMQPVVQIPAAAPSEEAATTPERPPNSTPGQMPFAEVSSLLDPNMKGSKARKYLISYEEIKRRLQAPEKMSLRSLAAYTRVSRGPASKKMLQESLNVLGLTPSTTTSVSSSFSKLTEGDTRALCEDLKDFAHDYIDYGNMAKQLIPDTNTVQHWSKMIESKNHLEDMRKCFRDPVNSGAFDSVTHGLGLGMLDVALDMIVMVIEQQIRILSGAAASDAVDPNPSTRRVRRRHRKARLSDGEKAPKVSRGATEPEAASKGKARGGGRKKARQEAAAPSRVDVQEQQTKAEITGSNVLTLISVGYQSLPEGGGTA